MTGILTLVGMLAVTCLFCKAFDKKPEEYFCVSIFTVIAVLYPFYCLDMLRLGRYVVYGLFVGMAVLCFLKIEKRELSDKKIVAFIPPPGICIFLAILLFFAVSLHDLKVELWDELRLWGAAPKALYATEKLQLGSDALMFPVMQSYPPAMPLLVYFVTALAPNFPEYQIFVVYAVFFTSLLLPVLRNLTWKQWPQFALLGICIIWVPCVFTSHGGDFGWFYNSLFIDPVLGALAGYAIYLSAEKPFSGWLSIYRFGITLLVLVLTKDSGLLFAIFACFNAVLLAVCEKNGETTAKRRLFRIMLSILPAIFAYMAWKYLLSYHGVSTDSSSHLYLSNLSVEVIQKTVRYLFTKPMLIWDGALFVLQLTFIPCFAGMLLCSKWLAKEYNSEKRKTTMVTWCAIVLLVIVFLVGNGISFGEELPSFRRYTSTLLCCVMIFLLLWSEPDILRRLRKYPVSSMIVVSILLVLVNMPFFAQWKSNKNSIDENEYNEISYAVYQIKQNEESNQNTDSNYYLLIADNMVENSRIHHRIYFDLLSSTAHVRNFYNDTNICDAPPQWRHTDVLAAAEQWSEKLIENDIDYVYIVFENDFTSAVLACLGAKDVEHGAIYEVQPQSCSIILERCN